MRTILLLVGAGIVGSAATGILTNYMSVRSSQEKFAAFARIQNADPDTFLPFLSKSIASCGSNIVPGTPNFVRYAKSAALVLGKRNELRANRGNSSALREQKALISSQMQDYMADVSDADFRIVAAELQTLAKDTEKQDCIVRSSVSGFKKP